MQFLNRRHERLHADKNENGARRTDSQSGADAYKKGTLMWLSFANFL